VAHNLMHARDLFARPGELAAAQARGDNPNDLVEISVPSSARGRRIRLVALCSGTTNGSGAEKLAHARSCSHKFFKVVGAA